MASKIAISRTSVHLAAGAIGAITLVGVWLREFGLIEGGIATTNSLLFIAACFALFFTRNADEYVAALWRTGANVAFMALLVAVILVPVTEGFVDGFMYAFTEDPGVQDLKTDLSPEIAFTGFFVAHFWARMRGTY